MRPIALAFIAVATLMACSHVDTGQIDYRIAEEGPNSTDCPPSSGDCRLAELNRRYAQRGVARLAPTSRSSSATANRAEETTRGATTRSPEAATASQTQSTPTPPPAQAEGATTPAPPPAPQTPTPAPASAPQRSTFQSDSLYSINLEQAVIGGTLLEGVILGREWGTRGQFIILANVFELDEGGTRRFLESYEYHPETDSDSPNQLRVVHYAGDAARHQPLNFSNIPLLGARPYQGHSVAIQIVIIEVDVRSGAMSTLLQTLADFGKGALPVPPGGQQILGTIGQNLFSGRGDDTIFDYRFVLNPPSGQPDSMQPILAPGRYVLRRQQNRSVPMNWNEIRLDHNTSRLYRRDGQGQWVEDRSELYLVLNIQQLPNTYPTEVYQGQTWRQARAALQDAANARDVSIEAISQSLTQVARESRSQAIRRDLTRLWQIAEERLLAFERLFKKEGDGVANCQLYDELHRDRVRGLAESDASAALDRFLNLYRQSIMAPPNGQTPLLPQQRTEIVAAVARYYAPVSEEFRPHILGHAAFEAKWAVDNSTFITDTIAQAKAHMRGAANCQELIDRGLAAGPQ